VLNPTPEEIDLQRLARALRARFGERLEESYLDGRTLLRDAVVDHLVCSALEAEEIVDTLEAMGVIRFPTRFDETHDAEQPHRWIIVGPMT
jgi:hypothetical protein